MRLFVTFTAAVTGLYLIFLDVTLGSSAPGVRTDLVGVAALSAVWVGFIAVNWFLTLGRVPRGVRREPEAIVVRNPYGRTVRFSRGSESELTVLQRYPAGWLSPEPTELVRVVTHGGPRATYLVGRDFLAL